MAEFWACTPRQLRWHQKAYHQRRGWLAWHVAALGRVERMPTLGELCGTAPPERKAMDPEDMLAAVRRLKRAQVAAAPAAGKVEQ